MSKLFRIFTAVFLASFLATGVSFAGPDDKTDGDPEIPQVTNPAGVKNPDGVLSGGMALQTPGSSVSDEADDRWLIALKAYLRLVRILTF